VNEKYQKQPIFMQVLRFFCYLASFLARRRRLAGHPGVVLADIHRIIDSVDRSF
jgi:hypothetical protein